MRRREFVQLAAGTAMAWPLAARAQEKAMPAIGYLSSNTPTAEAGVVSAIQQALAEAGFVEGRNIAITYDWSEGNYDRLPGLAAAIVRNNVSVIMTSSLPATLAAKASTSTIPIVFLLSVDPVEFGLAHSLNRPGGNLTGVTMLNDELTPKRLQLLHELIHNTISIGFLINPKNRNAASHRHHVEAAAQALGVGVIELTADSADQFETAFAAGRQQGIGALLVGDDPLFGSRYEQLVVAAARYAVPTMYYGRDFAVVGGLISYGASYVEMGRQAAVSVGQILKGAKPADLPIRQPTKFELVINLKTASALGLTVPQLLLATADEVIE
jgi:putative ABC transport system substrate-binding protein